MIQQGSYLKVIDNSSVKEISCIKVLKGGPRPHGIQGDELIGSVKSVRKVKKAVLQSKKHLGSRAKGKEWKRGDLVQALIVRTLKSVDRSRGLGRKAKLQTGIRLSFPKENAALLLGRKGKEPLGTRIKGPLSPTVRTKAYTKLLSLGGYLL